MTVVVHRGAVEAVKRFAHAAYPEEACGFLIGTWAPRNVEEARGMKNLAAGSDDLRYEIDPKETILVGSELRGTGRDIVGVFHSHPDLSARPSPQDLERAWEGYTYLIVAVDKGRPVDLRAWSLDEGGKTRAFQEVEIELV